MVSLERAPKRFRSRADLVRRTGSEFELFTDTLLVCTGLHVLPAVPSIPGLPSNLVPQSPPVLSPSELPKHPPVDGWKTSAQKNGVRVIHSSQYKKREEFKDRRVLILGVSLAWKSRTRS